MSDHSQPKKPDRSLVFVWIAALAAIVAFAAVYVTMGGPDNQGAATSGGKAHEAAARGNPLSTGAMTTFVFKPQPEALPDIRFVNGQGTEVGLDSLRGKVVLLNVWATWCAPCREEMPALNRLQEALGSDKFEVVALAVDKSGIEGARKFLTDIKADKLAVYADPTAKEGTTLKVIGMPTTILIDADGKEIGRLIGPAHWDSADAKRLIEAQLPKQG
ncbi:TlpA disulfide reductase family protein [Hyphomicrobium sp. NDB2Meth4]|uniref:TlpA family protein disulfide reductase n=1 Tax=Hyphomicrobium sp. NDB2Meth4 TaxID=1892846 RepID=UPI0009313AAF|nr:TlpA disulfide reductase family protein [Hyphomicrobium sp. NDB2Meth4]